MSNIKHHAWVELKYTPVEVEVQENGELNVYATEAAIEVAEEDAAYICWFCHAPLELSTYHTTCTGREDEGLPPAQKG